MSETPEQPPDPRFDDLDQLFEDLFRPRAVVPPSTDIRDAAEADIATLLQQARSYEREAAYLPDFAEEVREDALVLGRVGTAAAAEEEERLLRERQAEITRRQERFNSRHAVTRTRFDQALTRERTRLSTSLNVNALDPDGAVGPRTTEASSFLSDPSQLSAALEDRTYDIFALRRFPNAPNASRRVQWTD